jgi:monovalent cation/proton antiporter MnhG/PhaG subunit
MSPWDTAALTALAVVIAATWLGAIGLLRARDAYGRLHHVGAFSLLGPAALVAAFLCTLGHGSPTTLRAAIIAVLATTTGPVVAHAIARASRLRVRGTLEVVPQDAGEAR